MDSNENNPSEVEGEASQEEELCEENWSEVMNRMKRKIYDIIEKGNKEIDECIFYDIQRTIIDLTGYLHLTCEEEEELEKFLQYDFAYESSWGTMVYCLEKSKIDQGLVKTLTSYNAIEDHGKYYCIFSDEDEGEMMEEDEVCGTNEEEEDNEGEEE